MVGAVLETPTKKRRTGQKTAANEDVLHSDDADVDDADEDDADVDDVEEGADMAGGADI